MEEKGKLKRKGGPGLKPKYTVDQMCKALEDSKGLIFIAAKKIGCSPQTVHTYIKKYPKVKETKDIQRGLFVDTAESGLINRVNEEDQWAIVYVLNKLGKDRGYGDTVEIDIEDKRKDTREKIELLLRQTRERLTLSEHVDESNNSAGL